MVTVSLYMESVGLGERAGPTINQISLRANADPVQLSELRLVYVPVDSLTYS